MPCIVLIGGLIGSGKSALINFIFQNDGDLFDNDSHREFSNKNVSEICKKSKKIMLHKIIFDEMCSINEQADMMKTLKGWRNFRVDLLMASEHFISFLYDSECIMNGPLTERSHMLLQKLITLNRIQSTKSLPIIFVEDNFYYRSMRYEWFQIAQRANIGFCEIFLECPLDLAIVRNSSRGFNIPSVKIKMMLSSMEYPDSNKYKWEKYSMIFDSSVDLERSALNQVIDLIEMAAQNPAELLFNGEKLEAQMVCSKSAIHQADNILRKIASQKILNLRETLKKEQDLKDKISLLLNVRHELLDDIRRGNVCLSEDVTMQLQKFGVKSVQKKYEEILNDLFEESLFERYNKQERTVNR